MLCSLFGKENLDLKPVTLPLADAGVGQGALRGFRSRVGGSGPVYFCCVVLPWPFLEARGWEGLPTWWADPVPAKLDPAHISAVSGNTGPW